MRPLLLTLALLVAAGVVRTGAQAALRSFEEATPGAPPSGFTFTMTRQATPGTWVVGSDGAGRHLVHESDPAATDGFSIAVLSSEPLANVRVSARVKLTGGTRMGGVVWRYQNPDNFYAATLDLRAQDIALHRVVNGNRVRLEREDDLELDPEAWHSIRVEHEDDRIRVALGGIGVIRARERGLQAAGRAGVWSGGGSESAFDDLRVEAPRERRR